MPLELFPNAKRGREDELTELGKYVHFADLRGQVSDADSSADEEDYEEEPEIVGLSDDYGDGSGDQALSPDAVAALAALKAGEGDGSVMALTLPLLEVIMAAGRDVSLILVYEGTYSTTTSRGCGQILAVVEDCRRRNKYFDISKLQLFVVVMGGSLYSGANNAEHDATYRVFQTRHIKMSALPQVDEAVEGKPQTNDNLRDLSPLRVINRIFKAPSLRKVLWGFGSFWSPFILSLMGDVGVRNVVDLGIALGVCNSVQACAFTSSRGVGMLEGLHDDPNSDAAVAEIEKREAQYVPKVKQADGVEDDNAQDSAAATSTATAFGYFGDGQALRTGYGISQLLQDIQISLTNGPAQTRMTQAILRESQVRHVLALMQHNGMQVDIGKGISTLRAFVKRSQDIHMAIETVLLEPLRIAVGSAHTIGHPNSDSDVLDLLRNHSGYLIEGNLPSSSASSTTSDATSKDLNLTDQSLLSSSPLAASWMQLKKLQEGGALLQRFMTPLRTLITVSAGTHHPPKVSAALPLCTVSPTFNASSATGRIFTSKPNVQTLPTSTTVVTSGSVEGDAKVEALLAAYFKSKESNSEPQPVPPASDSASSPSFEGPRLTSNLRSFMVAPPGCKLLSLDFNQIELRMLAHLSQDTNLLAAFGSDGGPNGEQGSSASTQQGADVLRSMAQVMFNRSSLDEVSDFERGQAKVVVYGMLYGMGDAALQSRLEQAANTSAAGQLLARSKSVSSGELRAAFRNAFPEATEYMQQIGTSAVLSNSASSIGGRYRQFASAATAEGHADSNQSQYAVRTQAISMAIQGSAADILKAAMCEVADRPTRPSWATTGNQDVINSSETAQGVIQPCYALVMCLHDELLFVVPDDASVIAETVAHLRASMERQAAAFDLRLPLPVSVKIGPSFGELQLYTRSLMWAPSPPLVVTSRSSGRPPLSARATQTPTHSPRVASASAQRPQSAAKPLKGTTAAVSSPSPPRSFFPRIDFPAVAFISSASGHCSPLTVASPSSEWTFKVKQLPATPQALSRSANTSGNTGTASPRNPLPQNETVLPRSPRLVTVERQFGETDVAQATREKVFGGIAQQQWRRRRLFKQSDDQMQRERIEFLNMNLRSKIEANSATIAHGHLGPRGEDVPAPGVGSTYNLSHPKMLTLLRESGMVRRGLPCAVAEEELGIRGPQKYANVRDINKNKDQEAVGSLDPELESVPPNLYRPWSRLNSDAKEALDAVSTVEEIYERGLKHVGGKVVVSVKGRSKVGCAMVDLPPGEEVGALPLGGEAGLSVMRRSSHHAQDLPQLSRQPSVLRRHTQQLAFTVSPKRRRAKVVMLDARIGGLLFDEEATAVIPFTFGQLGDDHVSSAFSVSDCVLYQKRTETESGAVRAVRMMLDHQLQQLVQTANETLLRRNGDKSLESSGSPFGLAMIGETNGSLIAETSPPVPQLEDTPEIAEPPRKAPSLEYTDMYLRHLAAIQREMAEGRSEEGHNGAPSATNVGSHLQTSSISRSHKPPLSGAVIYSRLSDRLAAALMAEAEE